MSSRDACPGRKRRPSGVVDHRLSSGATLQIDTLAGNGEIYCGIENMDGTLDLNGQTLAEA